MRRQTDISAITEEEFADMREGGSALAVLMTCGIIFCAMPLGLEKLANALKVSSERSRGHKANEVIGLWRVLVGSKRPRKRHPSLTIFRSNIGVLLSAKPRR